MKVPVKDPLAARSAWHLALRACAEARTDLAQAQGLGNRARAQEAAAEVQRCEEAADKAFAVYQAQL